VIFVEFFLSVDFSKAPFSKASRRQLVEIVQAGSLGGTEARMADVPIPLVHKAGLSRSVPAPHSLLSELPKSG
jgi:hypothetical protein